MKPAWWNTNSKKKSQRKEKKVASELGGKPQPGSGNQYFAPGDIKLDNFLIEHKYTDSKSYSLTLATFDKIEQEAKSCLKLPMMVIEVQNKKFAIFRYEDVLP